MQSEKSHFCWEAKHETTGHRVGLTKRGTLMFAGSPSSSWAWRSRLPKGRIPAPTRSTWRIRATPLALSPRPRSPFILEAPAAIVPGSARSRGAATRLDDVRAIFVDTKRREIVAANGSPLQCHPVLRQSANGNVEFSARHKGRLDSAVLAGSSWTPWMTSSWWPTGGNHTIRQLATKPPRLAIS